MNFCQFEKDPLANLKKKNISSAKKTKKISKPKTKPKISKKVFRSKQVSKKVPAVDNQPKIESMIENQVQTKFTKFTGDFQKIMTEMKDASTIMTTQSKGSAKVENDIDNIKKVIQDIIKNQLPEIKNQLPEIREDRRHSKKDLNYLNDTMRQVINDISELRQDIAKIKENTEEKQEEVVVIEPVAEEPVAEENEFTEVHNQIVGTTNVVAVVEKIEPTTELTEKTSDEAN